jgi:hypothetical protein
MVFGGNFVVKGVRCKKQSYYWDDKFHHSNLCSNSYKTIEQLPLTLTFKSFLIGEIYSFYSQFFSVSKMSEKNISFHFYF